MHCRRGGIYGYSAQNTVDPIKIVSQAVTWKNNPFFSVSVTPDVREITMILL